jgi:hypothetical protein
MLHRIALKREWAFVPRYPSGRWSHLRKGSADRAEGPVVKDSNAVLIVMITCHILGRGTRRESGDATFSFADAGKPFAGGGQAASGTAESCAAFAEREQRPGSAACPCRITREAQFLPLDGQQVIDYRAFRRVLLHEVEDAADIIIVFIVRDLWHV